MAPDDSTAPGTAALPRSPHKAPTAGPSVGPPRPPHSGPSLCPLRVLHPLSPPNKCPIASSDAPFPPPPQALRPRAPPAPSPAVAPRAPSPHGRGPPTPPPLRLSSRRNPTPALPLATAPRVPGCLTAPPPLIGWKHCHSAKKGRRGAGGLAALRCSQARRCCRTLTSPAALRAHPVPTRIAGSPSEGVQKRLCSGTVQR